MPQQGFNTDIKMATAIIGGTINKAKGSFKIVIVDSLPDKGKPGLLYLILCDSPSENNIYDEYIWVENEDGSSGVWEKLGCNDESLNVDLLSYGVEWQPNVADPELTRVGNSTYHKTLPIQSNMRGCIYNPKEKKVVYWLDEDDWKYKKGGNPNKGEPEILARTDGYDGEVMVYVPEFWIRSWDEPDRRCVRVSPSKIDETWEHQPAIFIGAYKDTVLNTVPEDMGYLSTLEVNTAVSVANSAGYCRGGNNSTANDLMEDPFRRQLGKHITSISRMNMRTYERKAGKEILSYRQYKNVLYWLWVIEYATFNSQAAFNPALTSEGYHQGGMGNGITNMKEWKGYNGNYPICPNGFLNDLGNGTGVKDLVIPEFTYTSNNTENVVPAQILKSFKWRGIENTFGDSWNNIEGVIIDADANNHPDNMNYVYTTSDPSKYGDSASNIANMTMSGLEIHKDRFIKEWDLGYTGEIIPRLMGGEATTYKCDYHYAGAKSNSLRTLFLGGNAIDGGAAGLGFFYTGAGVGASGSYFGFRASCEA